MSAKEAKELKKVIKHNLCNRCGSCVGLSGGRISFYDRTGKYLPRITGNMDDKQWKTILNACSGRGFDFPGYRELIYSGDNQYHPFIGSYRNIYIGHTNDPEIRIGSASGGIISQILIWLLENKKIDGAVVLGMSKKHPWLTQPFIATTRDEILEAAQSKYIISSVNEILPEMETFQGKLAYVGLPGQVQSVRALQKAGHPSVKNIKYLFGPFYGNTLHFSSVKSFIRSYGHYDYRSITKLFFRYGEWPGKMRVEFNSGEAVELPKFHANYLIPFHIVKNSLLCTDLSNEFTDVSGGDAWAPLYEERGKGYSMIITRSEQGQIIIDELEKAGMISLTPIDENEAIKMHSHGYDLKKRGAFIRIRFRRLFFLPVPDYGYKLKGFTFKRYLMEVIIDSLFLTMGTKPARWLAEKIPPSWIGRVFEKTRKLWKKSTHNIKRESLN